MKAGLNIRVADLDPDYYLMEIGAANDRFAGSARIYADPDELSTIAEILSGFPKNPQDERTYQLGRGGSAFAGGFCHLRFHCIDKAGHARVDITLEDDKEEFEPGEAKFGFSVTPADIDQFVLSLREMRRGLLAEATLPIAL